MRLALAIAALPSSPDERQNINSDIYSLFQALFAPDNMYRVKSGKIHTFISIDFPLLSLRRTATVAVLLHVGPMTLCTVTVCIKTSLTLLLSMVQQQINPTTPNILIQGRSAVSDKFNGLQRLYLR